MPACVSTFSSPDRTRPEALVAHARACASTGDFAGAAMAFEEADRLVPLEKDTRLELQEARRKAAHTPALRHYDTLRGHLPTLRSPRRLRILLVTNIFPPQELGGYGRMMGEYAHELAKRGHILRVLCLNHPPFTRPGLPPVPDIRRELDSILDWHHLPPRFHADFRLVALAAAHNYRILCDTLEEFSPEAVLVGNLDGIGPATLRTLLAHQLPTLHVLGNHGLGYPHAHAPRHPRHALAPGSAWLQAKLEGVAGIQSTVIYPGSDLRPFYRAYPPPYDQLRIAYASLISHYKGADTLIEALFLLRQRGVPFTCDLAGDSTEPGFVETLKQRLDAAGLSERVRFHGYLPPEKLGLLFNTCNTLVFPSRCEEVFGKTGLEGMAAGLTLLSTATGGQAEIFTPEVSGLRVPVGDAQALADALAWLPANPERWRTLGKNGQERARDFATPHCVDSIESTLLQLLAAPPAPLAPLPDNHTIPRAHQALAALAEEKPEEALPHIEYILEHAPDHPLGQMATALYLHAQERHTESGQAYTNALLNDPALPQTYTCLSEICHALGDLRSALRLNNYLSALAPLPARTPETGTSSSPPCP